MRTPKTGKKRISLLLAAAILLTTPLIPAQAKTTVQEGAIKQQTITQKTSPANPAHHCTGKDDDTDVSSWSCVYFGSYPQTEVTGDDLTLAITVATYDADGDAWVNGTKYRRVSRNDLDDGRYFGNSTYRYFKWEPIKWRVLQNDGSTLFVVADKGLDRKVYHEEETSITWEDCTLRSWLNDFFYNTAFSNEEQRAIVSQNVANEDNPYNGTEGGNNTTDKVYLLSIGETTNPFYGFCQYNNRSASRYLKPSDYAHIARGVNISGYSHYAGNCCWWLRSPGYHTNTASAITDEGNVDSNEYRYVNTYNGAVVPALHINLSSDLWSLADPICSQHDWSEGETIKSPTCTQKGEKEFTCTRCGETKTEEIKATGHQNTEIRNKRAAVCNAAGYSGDVYCKDCNAKIKSGQVIAATGKHIWNDGVVTKSPTCTQKGEKKYTCTVCRKTQKEELEKIPHTYETTIRKATTVKNGSITKKCTVCGNVKDSKTIFSIKSAVLKTTSYTYNGKAKKPSVTVKDSNKKAIHKNNYTVAYKNNVNVGKATVTIKLKGNYKGTITKTFTICPKGTSISGKITAKSKGLTVTWKKQQKSTTGYQIQVSANKKFAKKATVVKTVKKNSTTKLTVKKLKPQKKYYVRIRTYKTVKGKDYYSGWSKVKSVTTKK